VTGSGLEIVSVSNYEITDEADGGLSHLVDYARAAEAGGVDLLLIGYSSVNPDGWMIGSSILAGTTRLKALIAHRPGVTSPTVTARRAATLAAQSGGRLALNVVSGGSAIDQLRDGDHLEHDARYERAAEYVAIMRRLWSDPEPYTFAGKYYHIAKAQLRLRPSPVATPAIFMGGASEAAKRFAVTSADTVMAWTEPIRLTKERFAEVERLCAEAGRPRPRFSVSARLIMAATEEEAWQRARALAPRAEASPGSLRRHHEDVGRDRQVALAEESLVHDERLWLGMTAASGGLGNTGALVGTPHQVRQALLRYVTEAGADTLVLTGPSGFYEPLPDGFVAQLHQEADQLIAARTGPESRR
jgi:alkanesulfonate monooxygenase